MARIPGASPREIPSSQRCTVDCGEMEMPSSQTGVVDCGVLEIPSSQTGANVTGASSQRGMVDCGVLEIPSSQTGVVDCGDVDTLSSHRGMVDCGTPGRAPSNRVKPSPRGNMKCGYAMDEGKHSDPSPRGAVACDNEWVQFLVDCAEGSDEHSDSSSTTGSVQDQPGDSPEIGSEQSDTPNLSPFNSDVLPSDAATSRPEALSSDVLPSDAATSRPEALSSDVLPSDAATPRPEVHCATHMTCDLTPTFAQRSDGSFVMELPGFNAEFNTMTFATEPLPSDFDDFQPRVDVGVVLPEVQLVVFDPLTRTPAGMCMAASVHKCVKLLEVPYGFNLIAKLVANSINGTQTLKERLYTNGCRNMHADVNLNYELRVNGSVVTSNHRLVLEVDFAFRCWLGDSAMGYLHEEEWWGLVTQTEEDDVFSTKLNLVTQTEEDDVFSTKLDLVAQTEEGEVSSKRQSSDSELGCMLAYIEHRVGEMYETLSTDSGFSSSSLIALKAEVAQLEKRAEGCNVPLCRDARLDACVDELHNGTQATESVQKSMLRRLLQLYQSLENAHQDT